jgi:RHS repeat-associated protein
MDSTSTKPVSTGVITITDKPFTMLTYLQDHLGSTRMITDEEAKIVSTHNYQPYGNEVTQANYETNTHKFTGHERDAETGLDYMLARHCDSTFGRFLQVDPGLDYDMTDPMSFNLYGYVRGNPIVGMDPTGEKTWGFGFNANLQFGIAGTVSYMKAWDDKGGTIYLKSKGIGVGSTDAGAALFFQYTDANIVEDLKGDEINIGLGGGTPNCAGAGVDYIYGVDSSKSIDEFITYTGWNINLGVSTPGLETHAVWEVSTEVEFNEAFEQSHPILSIFDSVNSDSVIEFVFSIIPINSNDEVDQTTNQGISEFLLMKF